VSTVFVNGIGLFGPGLPDWPQGREVLAGRAPYQPVVAPPPPAELLPATERRRATPSTRVALAVAQQALRAAAAAGATIDPHALPTVFATSSGNPDILHDLCEMLAAGDTQISPTKFHNSVHNAAAGYFSIGLASQSASTSICAYDVTAAAGLLEAVAQVGVAGGPLLLVSYDIPYPYPLSERRPLNDAWGAALLLGDAPLTAASMRIAVQVGDPAEAAESVLADAALEDARRHNPTARLLPLLRALALGAPAQVHLPFSSGTLAVAIDAAQASQPVARAA
jgi:hypothetical protein